MTQYLIFATIVFVTGAMALTRIWAQTPRPQRQRTAIRRPQ